MFERFTDQSRRVVVLAQEEARLLSHNYIGAEHLLLGLIHEGRGSAARVLAAADVTLDAARDQVETLAGRGQQAPSGHIPFTAAAKKSLELSQAEASALEQYQIGTGHVLLGLIRQGDSPALQVLGALGAEPAALRDQVISELREHPEQADTPRRTRLLVQSELGPFLRDTLPGLLTTIEERLTAIERHLGISSGAAGAGTAAGAGAGAPAEPGQIAEPGEPEEPPAAG